MIQVPGHICIAHGRPVMALPAATVIISCISVSPDNPISFLRPRAAGGALAGFGCSGNRFHSTGMERESQGEQGPLP